MKEMVNFNLGHKLVHVLIACAIGGMFVSSVFFRMQNPSLTIQVKEKNTPLGSMAKISHLMQKLQDNPQDVHTLQKLALAFMSIQAWDRAKHFWERILDIENSNNYARSKLAMCYFHKKEYEKSVQELKGVIQNNPDDYYAHYNLGRLYLYYLDQKEKGRRHLQKIIGSKEANAGLREKAKKELKNFKN